MLINWHKKLAISNCTAVEALRVSSLLGLIFWGAQGTFVIVLIWAASHSHRYSRNFALRCNIIAYMVFLYKQKIWEYRVVHLLIQTRPDSERRIGQSSQSNMKNVSTMILKYSGTFCRHRCPTPLLLEINKWIDQPDMRKILFTFIHQMCSYETNAR